MPAFEPPCAPKEGKAALSPLGMFGTGVGRCQGRSRGQSKVSSV